MGLHLPPSQYKGFSILEILIGLAVMAAALAFYLNLETKHQVKEAANADAQHMLQTQELFRRYFYAHRDEILAATAATDASNANVRKHCVVKVPRPEDPVSPGVSPAFEIGTNGSLAWSGGANINIGLKTCAFDLSLLQSYGHFVPGMLPITFKGPDTGGDWRYAAIIKRARMPGPDRVMNTADDVLGDDAEMLVVKLDEERNLAGISPQAWQNGNLREYTLQKIKSLGASGGYLPVGNGGACSSTTTQTTVCGQGWSINLEQWVSADWLAQLRAAMPPDNPPGNPPDNPPGN